MEVCCSCWTCLWTVVLVLKGVSSDPTSQTQFTLIRTTSTFNEAVRTCSPGVLPSTATEQEVQQILEVLSRGAEPDQEDLTVWIGLRKPAKDCTDPSLPLRGFRWEDTGSRESEVHTWIEEPKRTCTEVRCAALKVQSVRSSPRLGLVPVSCKTHFQYICKVEQGGVLDGPGTTTGPKLDQTTPTAFRQEPTEPGSDAEPSPGPGYGASPKHNPGSKPSPEPSPGSGTSRDTGSSPGSELSPGSEPSPSPGPGPGPSPCQYSSISSIRSFSLDSRNSSRLQVECWSGTKLDLSCSGSVWVTEDGDPADLSSVCQKCPAGFWKDSSGRCEDVDECSSGEPCRHTCVNTAGSFSCVCADPSDLDPSCSDPAQEGRDQGSELAVLVPVLAALAGLLILVVVVAVTIKCCIKKKERQPC